MSFAEAVIVSAVGGLMANVLSFFALRRFDRGTPPAIIRIDKSSELRIERSRVSAPEQVITERDSVTVIEHVTFVVRDQTRRQMLVSVVPGALAFATLFLVLVLM